VSTSRPPSPAGSTVGADPPASGGLTEVDMVLATDAWPTPDRGKNEPRTPFFKEGSPNVTN
jgi:hypothetical protein